MVDKRGGYNRLPFNKYFFKKWSHKMAYVLGFLYADGNITDAVSSRTQYIGFANTEKELLVKIKSTLKSKHHIRSRPPQLIKHHDGKKYISRELFILRIGSRSMFDDLIHIGVVPNKSKIVSFPRVPSGCLGHFVRGYFDGDGCIHLERTKGKSKRELIKRMRIVFTSGSRKFLIGLRDAISKVIYINGGSIYYENRAFRLVYATQESNLLCGLMYKNRGDLFLKRKYDIFQEYRKIRQLGKRKL